MKTLKKRKILLQSLSPSGKHNKGKMEWFKKCIKFCGATLWIVHNKSIGIWLVLFFFFFFVLMVMAARREEHWGSSVFCIFDFLKVIIRVNIYSCIVIAHNPCIVMVFYSYPPLSPPPPSSLFLFYSPTASSFHTSHFFIIFPFLFIHFILFLYLFIFSFSKSNTMLPSY